MIELAVLSRVEENETKWGHVKATALVMGDIMALRHELRIRAGAQAAGRRGTVTKVNSISKLQDVPIWAQGDASLHTDNIIKQRAGLSKHPEVQEQLQRWWETAQRSMAKRTHSGDIDKQVLPREEYIRISMLLARVMLPDFDEADMSMRSRGSKPGTCSRTPELGVQAPHYRHY